MWAHQFEDDDYDFVEPSYPLDKKPNIVVIYQKKAGVVFTDRMIEMLRSNGYNPVKISPEEHFNHLIFKTPEFIHGIILPGGPNVPSLLDDRKRFEINLLEYAIERKLPLLGICRGHQVIGEYFGGEIGDCAEHKCNKTIVVKDKSSLLHARLLHKLNTKPWAREKIKHDEYQTLFYETLCAHSQAVFFKTPPKDSRVKLVGIATDGIVESMEIDHILSYQHHNEENMKNKANKTNFNLYLRLVKQQFSLTGNSPQNQPKPF